MLKKRTKPINIRYMVQLSLLIAIQIFLVITPLGYIPIAGIDITLIHIPVLIGAITMGPAAGAVLGGVFGITSVIIATMRGLPSSFFFSPFMSQSGWSLVIALVPRIILGLLAGVLFTLLHRLIQAQFTKQDEPTKNQLAFEKATAQQVLEETTAQQALEEATLIEAIEVTEDPSALAQQALDDVTAREAQFIVRVKRRSARATRLAAGITAGISTIVHSVLVMAGIYFFFGAKYAELVSIPKGGFLAVIALVMTQNGLIEAILAVVICSALAPPLLMVQKTRPMPNRIAYEKEA